MIVNILKTEKYAVCILVYKNAIGTVYIPIVLNY